MGLLKERGNKSPNRCGSPPAGASTPKPGAVGRGGQSARLQAPNLAEPRERRPPGPDVGEGNVSEKGQVLERPGPGVGEESEAGLQGHAVGASAS